MGNDRSDTGADRDWSQLMAAAQGGDKAAYQTLLRDCTPFIRRVVRARGVQADRIDDVVQEVLLTVHRARQAYDPERSFAAWLSTIAQRRAIDALRRRGRQDRREVYAPSAYEDHADATAEAEGGVALLRNVDEIQEVVATLPPGQREAIETLAMRQLSLEEAARATGKTKGALKVNMHRALKNLRLRFGGSE